MSRETVARGSHLPTVLTALCRGVVDYAGTFPPATLALSEAIERYARYRSGDDAWMLHRFVVSARDLEAFARIAPEFTGGARWPLSVVCVEPEDIERACAWQSDAAVVESLEVKAIAPLDPLEIFVERPLPVDLTELQSLKEKKCNAQDPTRGRATGFNARIVDVGTSSVVLCGAQPAVESNRRTPPRGTLPVPWFRELSSRSNDGSRRRKRYRARGASR